MSLLFKIITLLLTVLPSLPAAAQEQHSQYHVFHNGNRIGLVSLYQQRSGEVLYLKMVSDIKVKMLLEIKIMIMEESRFLAGKLQYSRLYRTVNGKEKASRQTNAAENSYHILTDGKKGVLQEPRIDYNLIKLYCYEPVNKNNVYSDNFQQFVPIKSLGKSVYRIDLPDGNYNEFTYSKGICTHVSIHSSFYTIHLKRAA